MGQSSEGTQEGNAGTSSKAGQDVGQNLKALENQKKMGTEEVGRSSGAGTDQSGEPDRSGSSKSDVGTIGQGDGGPAESGKNINDRGTSNVATGNPAPEPGSREQYNSNRGGGGETTGQKQEHS